VPVSGGFHGAASERYVAWLVSRIHTLCGHNCSSYDLLRCDVVGDIVPEGQDRPFDDHVVHDKLHSLYLHIGTVFSR